MYFNSQPIQRFGCSLQVYLVKYVLAHMFMSTDRLIFLLHHYVQFLAVIYPFGVCPDYGPAYSACYTVKKDDLMV